MQGGPPHEHSLRRIVKGPITTPVVHATPFDTYLPETTHL